MRIGWVAFGLLVGASVLGGCTSGSVEASGAVEPPVQWPDGGWPIPDTPAGHGLAWVLDTINSPGLAAVASADGGRASDGGAMDVGLGVASDDGGTAGGADVAQQDGGTAGGADVDVEGTFSSSWLTAVSAARTRAELTGMAEVGPWEIVSYEPYMSRQSLAVVLKNASREYWRLKLQVDDTAKISRFEIHSAADVDPALNTWEGIDSALMALEGNTQWLLSSVDADGVTPIHTLNPDLSLAVASTFKLWVLAAVANSVHAGERTWTDVIPIQDKYKSFPSGRMQDEAAGTTFSIQDFALYMTALSDNTAADHLLFTVGRTAVEAMVVASGHHAPSQNLPFLSAREVFSMRLAVAPAEQQAYVDAPVEQRREMLARIDDTIDPRTALEPVWTMPLRIDQIEWFASSADLCRVMHTLYGQMLSDQPVLQVILSANLGTDAPIGGFRYVGHKGGSEAGVVSRTWLVQRSSDLGWRCVSFTWNDTLRDVDMYRAAYLGDAMVAAAGR